MPDLFHLNADAVRRLLPAGAAIEALRRFHAQHAMPLTDRQIIRDIQPSTNTFTTLAAWQFGKFIAVKLIGAFPGNTELVPPQPALQGIVVLIDGSTGRPLMTCDGAALTQVKTAADSALAVDILSRSDSRTHLLIGAGGLAYEFAVAIRVARPSVRRTLIWNRSPARAESLAASLSETHGDCLAVTDLKTAMAQADIVSALTNSATPVVRGRHVKSGAHVDLVGSYLLETREADDELLFRAGRVYVDNRAECKNSGDIFQPLASGVLSEEMIVADLFDLCSGRSSGRRGREEITVFKNIGGAHLDLVIAAELYTRVSGVPSE